ncbi:glycosyltransferase family 39 protein [Candidatus Woesearchaeota archaeon]|nr:glycosyltransferase family 39 protein [Candidatus Woesearchaeota archaeon]
MLYPALVLSAYIYIDKHLEKKVSTKKLAVSMLPFLILFIGLFATNLTALYAFNPEAFVSLPKFRNADDPFVAEYLTFTQNEPEQLDLHNNTLLDVFFIANVLSIIIYAVLTLRRGEHKRLTRFRQFLKTKHGKIFILILLLCIAIRLAGITTIGWAGDEHGWFRTGKALLLDNEHTFELWKPPISLYMFALPSVVYTMLANDPLTHYHPIGFSRTLPFFAGVLVCIIIYATLRRATNENTALAGFAMASFYPFFIQYSRSAMNEIFLILFSAISVYFLYLGSKEKKYLPFAVIAAALAFATKGTGLYIFIPVICIALYQYLPWNKNIRAIIILLPLFTIFRGLFLRPEAVQATALTNLDRIIPLLLGTTTPIILTAAIAILLIGSRRRDIGIAAIPTIGALAFMAAFIPLIKNLKSNLTSVFHHSMLDYATAGKHSLFDATKLFAYVLNGDVTTSSTGSLSIWFLGPFILGTFIIILFLPAILDRRSKTTLGITAVAAATFLISITGISSNTIPAAFLLTLFLSAAYFVFISENSFLSAAYYVTATFIVSVSIMYRISPKFIMAIIPFIMVSICALAYSKKTRKAATAIIAAITIPLAVLAVLNYPSQDYDMDYQPDHALAEYLYQHHKSQNAPAPAHILWSDFGYVFNEIYGDTTFPVLPLTYFMPEDAESIHRYVSSIDHFYTVTIGNEAPGPPKEAVSVKELVKIEHKGQTAYTLYEMRVDRQTTETVKT